MNAVWKILYIAKISRKMNYYFKEDKLVGM